MGLALVASVMELVGLFNHHQQSAVFTTKDTGVKSLTLYCHTEGDGIEPFGYCSKTNTVMAQFE